MRRALGRDFGVVFAASTLSNLGDGVLVAALPLLARQLTSDPLAVSSVTAAATAPWLLFGLVAGAVVDRSARLTLMVRVDAVRAATAAVFAVLVATDSLRLVTLVAVVAALGVAETLFDTAAQAVLPSVVGRGDLERANARLFGAQLAANSFVGPPLGAAMFGLALASPVALDAATFAVSAALLRRLLPRGSVVPDDVGERRGSIGRDVREGLSWLWADRGVRAFAVGAAVVNLAHTGVMAIAVLFLRDELGASATGFGVALAGTAVGGVLGTQVAPVVVERLGRRSAVVGSIGTFAVALLVAGTATSAVVATIGLSLFGLAGEVWNVVAVSYRQARVPDVLLGRVMASYRVLAYGAMPVGALLGGVVAGAFGLRAPFTAGAALVFVLLLYFVPATRGEVLRA